MEEMRGMKSIKVVVKNPGRPAQLEMIENTLTAFQSAVKGYIEAVTVGNIAIICNEEGRINGMPFNCALGGTMFYGPVVIAGIDGCEFCDAPDKEIYKNWREELAS